MVVRPERCEKTPARPSRGKLTVRKKDSVPSATAYGFPSRQMFWYESGRIAFAQRQFVAAMPVAHPSQTLPAMTPRLVPEQYVEVNEEDVGRYGFTDGELVCVVSRRGS